MRNQAPGFYNVQVVQLAPNSKQLSLPESGKDYTGLAIGLSLVLAPVRIIFK